MAACPSLFFLGSPPEYWHQKKGKRIVWSVPRAWPFPARLSQPLGLSQAQPLQGGSRCSHRRHSPQDLKGTNTKNKDFGSRFASLTSADNVPLVKKGPKSYNQGLC